MGAIANLSASLRWDLDDFQRGTSIVEGTFKNIIGLAGKVGDAVTNAGKKMTVGLTLPLAGLGVLFTKAASDAAELQSAFDYTFGNMAGTMNKWAEQSGDAMGRSTQQMQEGAFALGGLFKAAAPTEAAAARLSKQFTELAVDAGSFFNTPFDEALQKIRSGLAGESEPLRAFNVFINEAAVEAKALELGLITSGQELNEFGKIMARSALIAEGLKPALGDAERTASSLANSVVRLKAQVSELAVEMGQYLEPYAKALANTAERLVTVQRTPRRRETRGGWIRRVSRSPRTSVGRTLGASHHYLAITAGKDGSGVRSHQRDREPDRHRGCNGRQADFRVRRPDRNSEQARARPVALPRPGRTCHCRISAVRRQHPARPSELLALRVGCLRLGSANPLRHIERHGGSRF